MKCSGKIFPVTLCLYEMIYEYNCIEHHSFGSLLERRIPDSKIHGANMGPTWVLSAPDGPHIGPMNLAVRDVVEIHSRRRQQ